MKIFHKTIPLPDDIYIRRYFSDGDALFDIETTGLSPKKASIYLIGLTRRQGDTLQFDQFLAQKRQDEPQIIQSFYQTLNSASTIITFNGQRFDFPFLKARETACGFPEHRDTFHCLDLYQTAAKMSHFFQLPDKKQKSFEHFLNITREDAYTGGELIPLFFEYEKNPDPRLEELLLLHNYEDLLGMVKLLALLSYRDFFAEPANVRQVSLTHSRPYGSDVDIPELLIALQPPMPFPADALRQNGPVSLKCQDATAYLLIKVLCSALRFYYENYQDYYYLPDEDMAVHKSVASFVDRKHRKKATASTCYTKRNGQFLPQGEILFSPCFYPGEKKTISYFELTEDFLSDSHARNRYATHLLRAFSDQYSLWKGRP